MSEMENIPLDKETIKQFERTCKSINKIVKKNKK